MSLIYESDPGSDDFLNSTAEKYFNVKYLYPYQRLVISNVLEIVSKENPDFPSSQIVILPTGAGKSLCFMLPALLIEKPTLIIFPLLSLMTDQKRRLDNAGIETAVIKGGQSRKERSGIFKNIKNKRYKVILSNPETLKDNAVLENFKPAEGIPVIDHLVVDEAHTVSEWGDSFRSAYLETGIIISSISPSAVTAFTATASKDILKRLREILFPETQVNLISANPDRTNIKYNVIKSISKEHDIVKLAEKAEKPALIFCSSRISAELTAELLIRRSSLDNVKFYHAGLEPEEKKNTEEWFFHSDSGVLCSTCAYGMGVDKSDIRTVIHFELPGSAESYLQESGRGGRDRKTAYAQAIISIDDIRRLNSLKSEIQKERYKKLLNFALTETECRRNILLKALSEESAVDYCEGCDICDKNYNPEPEGRNEILTLVKNNNKTLNVNEAVSILTGSENVFKQEDLIAQSNSYNKLVNWTENAVKEGINSLIKEGIIKKGKILRKNLLIIKRKKLFTK